MMSNDDTWEDEGGFIQTSEDLEGDLLRAAIDLGYVPSDTEAKAQRQYDENVSLIAKLAEMEGQRDALADKYNETASFYIDRAQVAVDEAHRLREALQEIGDQGYLSLCYSSPSEIVEHADRLVDIARNALTQEAK